MMLVEAASSRFDLLLRAVRAGWARLGDRSRTGAASGQGITGAGDAPAGVVQLALRPLLGRVGELAAMSLGINLLSLAVPVFVLQVYDRVVFHGGLVTLGGLVLGVVIAIAFDFVLR